MCDVRCVLAWRLPWAKRRARREHNDSATLRLSGERSSSLLIVCWQLAINLEVCFAGEERTGRMDQATWPCHQPASRSRLLLKIESVPFAKSDTIVRGLFAKRTKQNKAKQKKTKSKRMLCYVQDMGIKMKSKML